MEKEDVVSLYRISKGLRSESIREFFKISEEAKIVARKDETLLCMIEILLEHAMRSDAQAGKRIPPLIKEFFDERIFSIEKVFSLLERMTRFPVHGIDWNEGAVLSEHIFFLDGAEQYRRSWLQDELLRKSVIKCGYAVKSIPFEIKLYEFALSVGEIQPVRVSLSIFGDNRDFRGDALLEDQWKNLMMKVQKNP